MTATASALSVLVIRGAGEVPAEAWNRLARRGCHLHGWFTGAERSGWQGRHVAVRGPDGPLAIVPAFLVTGGAPHDLHDRWLGSLHGLAARTGLGLRPVLSVQAPFAQCSDPLGDEEALAGALPEVFAALEATARRAGARAVVWPFVDEGRSGLIGAARERGYEVCYAGLTARLEVTWGSFDEYLMSRSKNVRRTIRADLRALACAGIRTESLGDFRRHAPAMDELYRDAFRRRNGRPAPTPRDVIARLAGAPFPGLVAQLAWESGRLVGMSLNPWAAGVLDGTFAAFVPGHVGGPAYYHDLCYEPVRLAGREGITAIDLGASALYAKVLRGATPRRRVTLVRGSSRGWHAALRVLGRHAARRTEAKERAALGRLFREVE